MHADALKTGSKDEIEAKIWSLELRLMDPASRRNSEAVAALLAEDFREFGSSGRVWSKETILALLAGEAYDAPAVEGMSAQEIAPGVVLVTYRTVRHDADSYAAREVLRSSLWIHCDGRWQVIFHQGTKVPDARASAQRGNVASNPAGQDLHADAEDDERGESHEYGGA